MLTVKPITHHQCCIGMHGVWGLHFSLFALSTLEGNDSLHQRDSGKSFKQHITIVNLFSGSLFPN